MADRFDPAYADLLKAASLAARAHAGQLRKDGATPYVAHPFRVCLIVRDLFGIADPAVLATALLHDAIEDTKADHDEIAAAHGVAVADGVATLSKDKRLADGPREAAYRAALRSAAWPVKAVKLADLLDNLLDMTGFSPERQREQLAKIRQNYDAVRGDAAAELRRPLTLVGDALDAAAARLGA